MRNLVSRQTLLTTGIALSCLVLVACGSVTSTDTEPKPPTVQSTPVTAIESDESAVVKSADEPEKTESGQKIVYLTYDDGPAEHTAPLLKVLKQNNAQATFFLIGQRAAADPKMVERIHKEGHYLGNHSWSHPAYRRLTPQQIKAELSKTQNVSPHMGNCYRPPYGGARAPARKVAKELGLTKFIWDIATGDWDVIPVETIKRRILSAKPGDNILMHDGPALRQNTVKATAEALPILKKRGFVFKGLPACAPPN